MKIKTIIIFGIAALIFALSVAAQDAAQPGFVIKLKNGSTVRGRTLSRDEATGALRLVMTEASDATPKSYAVIAADDAMEISSSSTDSDSIRIKLKGGSDLRCKEFSLNGDSVAVKLGSASKVEILWSDIQSISFAQ
jgi:hypothetical protein